MKRQNVKIIFKYFLIILFSFHPISELMAQIFFDINPHGSVELCPAASITLQADQIPPGYTYQWMKEDYGPSGCGFNTMIIPGATSQNYTANQTSVYWCTAIDSNGFYAGSSMSSAWVTSLSDPVHICYSSSLNFCQPDSVYLFVNNIWLGPMTTGVQWQLNGTDISSANSYNFYAKTSGSYRCRVYNNCGFQYSDTVIVTANPKPSAIITTNGPATFCSGGSVTLSTPIAANRSYQWKKGNNLIPGATLSSYTATTGGNYRVMVTNSQTGCSKTTANASIITVNPLPAATITPQGPSTFCTGDSVQLKANYNSNYTYQWKKNNVNISGATTYKFEAKAAGNYKVKVTNTHGCTKLSNSISVTVPCREGNENVIGENNFQVSVFPNPSSGEFKFELSDSENENSLFVLYDIKGRMVMREHKTGRKFIITCSKLVPGIYSAVITNQQQIKIVRLIKIK